MRARGFTWLDRDQALTGARGCFAAEEETNGTTRPFCVYSACSLKSFVALGGSKLFSDTGPNLNWDAYNTDLDCSSLSVIHLINSLIKHFHDF